MKQRRDERAKYHTPPTELEESRGYEWQTILRTTDPVCGLDHLRGATRTIAIDSDSLQDVIGDS